MSIKSDSLLGKWSVHEVTKTFSGQDAAAVSRTLALLDSGEMSSERFLAAAGSAAAITVEILASGRMFMSIVQSLQPNIPAAMHIKAAIAWELQDELMFTQALTDKLATLIVIDTDHRFSNSQLKELKRQIPGIEAAALQDMKTNPLWTNRNQVRVLYCGSRYFLTRSETGTLMLHQKIYPVEGCMIKAVCSHAGLTCKDPVRIEEFYIRYFGFKRARVYAPGPGQVVMIKAGNFYLELFKATAESLLPAPEKSGPEYPGWRHLCFLVDNLDEKLKELGNAVKITQGPVDMSGFIKGMKVCWVADPEGNIIELNQGYVDEY